MGMPWNRDSIKRTAAACAALLACATAAASTDAGLPAPARERSLPGISQGKSPPVVSKSRPPIYPAEARQLGQQGRVMVRALVDTQGRLVGLTSGGSREYGICLSLTVETARQVLAQVPFAIDAFPQNYLTNLHRNW